MGSTAAFLLVLTLIVFIHEYGHFQVARWCGVGVDTFAVGFGKELIGRTDKNGTRWKLGWIPIGGYVKFEDDANAASMPSQDAAEDAQPSETAFHSKPLPSRAAVVVAGPIANFILAIIIYTVSFMSVGERISLPIADAINPGSAAEIAGMKAGDRINEIDGAKIHKFKDIQSKIMRNQGDPMTFVIDRNGERLSLTATPKLTEIKDLTGSKVNIRILGIKSTNSALEKRDLGQSFVLACEKTWDITVTTLNYVRGIIVGRESTKQLAGPLGIARTTGYVAAEGVNALFQLAALLSVTIGLINLFPIPLLDGGHLMYYAIEAVRGKPLGQSAQDIGFKVGFAFVLTLMIVATWNDIARFFSS